MKTLIRYGSLVIGCLLIAFGIDYFLIPNGIVSFGIDGLSLLSYYTMGLNVSIIMLALNIICILIGVICFKNKEYERYILPSILIPIFTLLLSNVYEWYPIELPEVMLTLLVSGFIIGTGYTMVYKQGFSAGGTLLLEELVCRATKFHSKVYSYIIDIILAIAFLIATDYEVFLYSVIVIAIIRFMVSRAKFGISNSKMFYIITSKEAEVNKFITRDLKGELSVLESKGGYSNKDNKIFLCVIPTEEYFKLKEGIKTIDPKAFIAVTDTYDVVNRRSF